MHTIRNSFLNDLNGLMILARSLTCLLKIGVVATKNRLSEIPNSTFKLAIDYPSPTAVTSESVNLADALVNYENNDLIVYELVHAQFVQKWHGFLDDLFKDMLVNYMSSENTSYLINNCKFTLDLRIPFTPDNLVESACKEFSFSSHDDRLNKIIKGLRLTIPDEVKKAVKKQVNIRNIFQHNGGVLRPEDIDKLQGCGGTSLLDNSQNSVLFNVGERLTITYWELERAKENFQNLANWLVPPS